MKWLIVTRRLLGGASILYTGIGIMLAFTYPHDDDWHYFIQSGALLAVFCVLADLYLRVLRIEHKLDPEDTEATGSRDS